MTPDEARQRALEAAQEAFADAPQEGLAPWVEGVRRAITAYERALWQPAETAPHGVPVLVEIEPFNLMQGVRSERFGTWMVGAQSIIGKAPPAEPSRWRPMPPRQRDEA